MGDGIEAAAVPDDLIGVDHASKRFAGLFPSVDHPQDQVLALLWQGITAGQVTVFAMASPPGGATRHAWDNTYPTFLDKYLDEDDLDETAAAVAPQVVAYSVDTFLRYFISMFSKLPSRLPQDDEACRRELQRLPLEAFDDEAVKAFRSACYVSTASAEAWLRERIVRPQPAGLASQVNPPKPEKAKRPLAGHQARADAFATCAKQLESLHDPWGEANALGTRRMLDKEINKICQDKGLEPPGWDTLSAWKKEIEEQDRRRRAG